MILRGIEGHYIFHYGEECGGEGSRDLAYHHPEFLQQFDFAIALDRGYVSDIIVSQCGGRTASDAFAHSLATALALPLHPACGVYTDTAEYSELIPECSNLSVGYYRAHTSNEELHTLHLYQLLDRLCKMDQSALVVARDPAAVEHFGLSSDWYTRWRQDDLLEERGTVLDFPIAEYWCDSCDILQSGRIICELCGADIETGVFLDPDYAEIRRSIENQLKKVN